MEEGQQNWWLFGAAVIGAVTGVVSLFLLLFSAGRRIGQLETKVDGVDAKSIGQREWGELQNKVETLYRVYVLEALSKDRNGNADQKRKGR